MEKQLQERAEDEETKDFEYGQSSETLEDDERTFKKPKIEKVKPDFNLSGKLSEEQRTTTNGTILKFTEPADARKPDRNWKLMPFKGQEPLETIPIHNKSVYLFGRDRSVVDIPLDHPSCSKQHAAIQFRAIKIQNEDTGDYKTRITPYIIDLESTNGTLLNKAKIEDCRYMELQERDIITFGFSTREYVLVHDDLVE